MMRRGLASGVQHDIGGGKVPPFVSSGCAVGPSPQEPKPYAPLRPSAPVGKGRNEVSDLPYRYINRGVGRAVLVQARTQTTVVTALT